MHLVHCEVILATAGGHLDGGSLSIRELGVLRESNVYHPPPMEINITPMLSAVSSSSPLRLYGRLLPCVGPYGEKPAGSDSATAP
jgi:hypothetical protein